MDSADIQKLVWLAGGIVAVLVAAGLVWWVIKAVFLSGGSNLFGGRDRRRLGLVEWTSIGGGRQLLLVRRDDVEHLILTGGPIDLIVESGIGKEEPALQQAVPSISFQESYPQPESYPRQESPSRQESSSRQDALSHKESFPRFDQAQASGFEPARESFEPVREAFEPAHETVEAVRETSARRKIDEDADLGNGHLHGVGAASAANRDGKRDSAPLILSVEHAE